MHIYFSGIGGVGIGPLARIAKDLGHDVTGSNNEESRYTESVRADGITVHVGQTTEQIAEIHDQKPIDWFVYTSGLPEDHPELRFVQENGIKASKRDAFINEFMIDAELKMLAVAGTHGKTGTTGMLIWMLKQLNIPASYSIGTNISFGPNGKYEAGSQYFIYEADEFDRNFLKFNPFFSIFTSVDYDHPDIYKTVDEYKEAFVEFAGQSNSLVTWQSIADYLQLPAGDSVHIIDDNLNPDNVIKLIGKHVRRNAFLAVTMLNKIFPDIQPQELLDAINSFPGTERRMEKLADNLYTDYGHHPVEIKATLEAFRELGQPIVAVYQPHQNVRQHEVQDQYSDSFSSAEKVYWLPTYLSREQEGLAILQPEDLIAKLSNPEIAEPAEQGDELKQRINNHRQNGDLVILLNAGELDTWARQNLIN